MSVLYLNNWKNLPSGWSRAGSDYIMALDSVGVDVRLRHIHMGGQLDCYPEISEMEKRGFKNCSVVVQHVLPPLMTYSGDFQNIGLFVWDSDSICKEWVRHLNMMDKVIVPNNQLAQICVDSGVKVPVYVVPHAVNSDVYSRSYEPLNLPTDGCFTFYFIGELIKRKNLTALLKAFHLEFNPDEPVKLVIKSSKPGCSAQDSYNAVNETCNIVKETLRIRPTEKYSKEIVISEHLSNHDLLRLHKSLNCLVAPSCGESWGYAIHDSMGFGNCVLSSNVGGPADYVPQDFLVDGVYEPIFSKSEHGLDINNSNENWFSININDLRSKMRWVYENYESSDMIFLRNKCKDVAKSYDYSIVGELFKKVLES